MDCGDTRARLVAWQDRELPEAEARQVLLHLASCALCAERDRALRQTCPWPGPPSSRSPRVQARLRAALDEDRLLALARARPAPTSRPTRRDSSWAWVIAAAALGMAGLGLGAAWLGPPPGSSVAITHPQTVPAGEFLPAAFSPEEDGPGGEE